MIEPEPAPSSPRSEAAPSDGSPAPLDGHRIRELMDGLAHSAGAKIDQDLRSATISLNIFEVNYQELTRLLVYLTKAPDSMLLSAPMYRDQFGAHLLNVVRLLHNFVASANSLVDHLRRISSKLLTASKDQDVYRERTDKDFSHDSLSRFITNLRNYFLHYDVPPIEYTFSMNRASPLDDFESTRTLTISRDRLLEWDGWSKEAKIYLASPDKIDIEHVVVAYRDKIVKFHAWFHAHVRVIHANALNELHTMQCELFLINLNTNVSIASTGGGGLIAGGGESIFHGILSSRELIELERMGSADNDARARRAIGMLERLCKLPQDVKDKIIALYQEPNFLPRRPAFGVAPRPDLAGDDTLALMWSSINM